MIDSQDILEIVKTKRPNLSLEDSVIVIAVNEVEQKIKNYCTVPEVPDALRYTWANMAIDLLDYENAANTNSDSGVTENDINSILAGNFGTISMGDTSWKQGEWNYSSPYARGISAHTLNLDDIVLNYREDLNKFRRIW